MAENMLDYIRILLYSSLIVCGFLLYQNWEKDRPKQELPTPATTTSSGRYIPDTAAPVPAVTNSAQVAVQANTAPSVTPTVPSTTGQIIKVTTDTLEVSIDTHGGDIVATKLLHYPESLGSQTPFVLLNNDPKTRYVAESGLLSKQGPDTSKEQAVYNTAQANYMLPPGDKNLEVTLNWTNQDGLKVNKVYTFTRDSYEIGVRYDVDNQSKTPWEGNLYTQLMRTDNPPPNHGGMISLATYFGAAISSPQSPFVKVPFKEMQSKELNQTITDGWAAMIQHYFISAWIPPKTALSTYYSKVLPNGLYTIGMIGSQISAQPGQKVSTESKLYAGPAITNRLEQAAPTLKLTIDYGWFWMFSAVIFWMMQKIYDVIGNWGWAIVLVTFIIKLLFYPLSAKSYRSMSALKKLQPRMELLKERYGDDKQKLTQETLQLYREEKVNPMSGCLPVLVQIPVFIALYWVLVESVELRQAPFILWIRDLSQPDPYYVLPLLMGIAMFIQQRLNPPPPDPMQAKVMMAMPFIFVALFLNFPAGLMLYWFVNNTLSVLQQWFIMNRTEKQTSKKIVKK